MNSISILENIKKTSAAAIALIDPDKKNDSKLTDMLDRINRSNFDAIFVGGSVMMDESYRDRMSFIKRSTTLPIILFPGSYKQITSDVDCILFLNLISGRNPQYLIGEQVKAAPIIYSLNIPSIPTSYILLDGGTVSAVESVSSTTPLSQDNYELVLAHILAGEYMGNALTYLECGSNAKISIDPNLVSHIKKSMNSPLIIGGGIKSSAGLDKLVSAGADYFVLSSIIEDGASAEELLEITSIIHAYGE